MLSVFEYFTSSSILTHAENNEYQLSTAGFLASVTMLLSMSSVNPPLKQELSNFALKQLKEIIEANAFSKKLILNVSRQN